MSDEQRDKLAGPLLVEERKLSARKSDIQTSLHGAGVAIEKLNAGMRDCMYHDYTRSHVEKALEGARVCPSIVEVLGLLEEWLSIDRRLEEIRKQVRDLGL